MMEKLTNNIQFGTKKHFFNQMRQKSKFKLQNKILENKIIFKKIVRFLNKLKINLLNKKI